MHRCHEATSTDLSAGRVASAHSPGGPFSVHIALMSCGVYKHEMVTANMAPYKDCTLSPLSPHARGAAGPLRAGSWLGQGAGQQWCWRKWGPTPTQMLGAWTTLRHGALLLAMLHRWMGVPTQATGHKSPPAATHPEAGTHPSPGL